MNEPYDILILGSGPIAASTAYFLTKEGGKNIGMVTQDPIENRDAAYVYAGGSVRWFWPDDLKTEMTTQTAEFIKDLDANGVDISLVSNGYLFLQRGKFVPSYNISSKKLIDWFIDQSKVRGLKVCTNEVIKSVTRENDMWVVVTDKNRYVSRKVLLALGVQNKEFIPGYSIEIEKRELFVLDIPIGENEEKFPHTIVPIKNGVAYIFIKKFPEGLRFVVGQEDVLEEDSSEPIPEERLQQLFNAGLVEVMPFLKNSHVEKYLWAFDAKKKTLTLEESQQGLVVANCGSAIRSCVWIGKEVTKKLKN